ncbi:MAG: hypothetical protein JXR58_00145 [Bacteroidales bacterium]|nr:hypothetical protein [Bacteroidales bacterium]
MRLRKIKNKAEEEIINLINKGYELHKCLKEDYLQRKTKGIFSQNMHQEYMDLVDKWGNEVIKVLNSIFPTDLESNKFLHPPHEFGAIQAIDNDDYEAKSLRIRLMDLLKGLDIIKDSLVKYTDLPIGMRLYVEDIDSFNKVRDINPDIILSLLSGRGYFDKSEEEIQLSFENILNEPFHKKDWGGEYNDLYTANIIINGARRSAAFLLKGNGLRKIKMEISDCGQNGDQIVRLFESPADLFIIQFVGNISEAIIKDVEVKVAQKRISNESACFCLINGQDTARLLKAYNLI